MQDPKTLMNCIVKCNAYFHLNLEGDKQVKRYFYTVKDNIVREIIKGNMEGLKGVITAHQKHGDARIVAVEISDGIDTISMHFPYKLLPPSMRKFKGEWQDYHKAEDIYQSHSVSKEEFDNLFQVLIEEYRKIYRNRILSLSYGALIQELNTFVLPKGYVIQGDKHSGHIHIFQRKGLVDMGHMYWEDAKAAIAEMCKMSEEIFKL